MEERKNEFTRKRLLNVVELSQYLGISINTVYSWVWLKKIPCVKCGRLVKFDLLDIDSWIEKNKRKDS